MIPTWTHTYLAILLILLYPSTGLAEDRSPQTLLREASSYAARIDDDSVKHHVLQDILWAQQKIGDEVGAIQTAQLELSGNRDNALEIVVAIQASRGHIREAEATLRGISNHITRANAASHIPVAYAAVGDIPKALQLAAQLPNNYAARGDAFYRIAEIQANGGDVPGALATMKDEWDSNPYRLIPLLKVQLAAGSWDQAIQITKLAEDPWYRSYLLWAVAMNGKTHAQKRNVAATIPVRGVKAWAYKHIAEAQLTDGDLQGCLASLKVATQEAPATYNNFARADLQWRIAVLYAHAHDLVQAKRVAMVIEKEGHRNNALRDIIEIQVKEHDDTGALETALLGTSEDSLTDYALSRTAERQVVVESVDKAMDTILQIKNAESRNVAFASVANAAAEAGRIAAALKLLSVHRLAVADALRFVETTGASEQRKQFGDQAGKLLAAAHLVQHAVESTLGEIVKSRAGNGALQEALGYALLIPEASAESGRAIGRIAFHQTKAGNVDAALQWIARAQLPSHKAVALTGVAHALIAKEKK